MDNNKILKNKILDRVNFPSDIKDFTNNEFEELAAEIREIIIEVVSDSGGHLSSNLGVVDLTLALHKVFNCPKDKIIWDVGHQSYTHKIITGRKDKIFTIRKKVLEGGSLADALREQHFDEVVCNMIAAGEETGQLEAVAARLAQLLEHRQALNQELLSATLYPAIILGFGMLVMLFLMAVVVPKMVAVFERAGGELPTLTKIVITVSDLLRDYGGWMIVTVAVLLLTYRLLMQTSAFREERDNWLLRLPGIGSLLVRIDTARFSRTLGMLLAGGVPALAAMHIANQSWSLAPLKHIGDRARESLREGESLAQSLKLGGHIPSMATQLLAVGEQSGKLDAMLLRIADHYEKEVSRNLKRMLTIAEPVLVMIMALGVGSLALAILLPIAEMNELVK